MKIIYLAAYKAEHPNWNIIYQDINGKRDIGGDNVHRVIEYWLEVVHAQAN